MGEKFYITTAIAYPNGKPHLGHALEIIQADVFARFHKLLGKDVFFQTGTDEHGLKNWQTAQKEGKDILEFLDNNVAIFKELYEKLNIKYDYFIRTSDKKVHYPGAKKLWKELVKSGDIYKQNYEGIYCTGCESFKIERELVDEKCPIHPTREIEKVEEENYFFKLSKYREEVAERIKSDEYKVIPKIRKNEILSFLADAKDISFSRSIKSLPWGIPVPDDDKQVMYVWCDALSNYITGVGYGSDEKKFKEIWPADAHIIGKDILRFHAGFWPAMLMSANIALPKKLFVHGFILSSGAKMSTSTGNVVEPFQQIKKYGTDQFRYYILGSTPLGGDGDYSEEVFKERINTELVGNLSNFCYRVLSFTNKNFDSKIGKVADEDTEDFDEKVEIVKKAYEDFDFKRAIDEVMAYSALGNKYFQEEEPWKVIKDDKEKAHEIIGFCVNLVKNLSVLVEPFMPSFSKEIQKQLNLKNLKWDDINFDLKNHKIGASKIVYEKVEGVEEKPEEKKEEDVNLNLKVAMIEEIKDHPDAEKLYIMKIDLGNETRQLVAGLKDYYKKEKLIGKKIIVVTNLEPAKLRGELSEGMLLAADGKDRYGENKVGVLYVDESPPGDQAIVKGMKPSKKQITFKEFQKISIRADQGRVFIGDKQLRTSNEFVKVERVLEGKVR